jgi:hypothetical protein
MDHQQGMTSDRRQVGEGTTHGGSLGSPRPQWHRPVLQQHGVGAIAGGTNAYVGETVSFCYPSGAS